MKFAGMLMMAVLSAPMSYAQDSSLCFGFNDLESFVGAQIDAPEIVSEAISRDPVVADLFNDSADLFILLPTAKEVETSVREIGLKQTTARFIRQLKRGSFRGRFPNGFPNAFIQATNVQGETITSLGYTGSDSVTLYGPNGEYAGSYEQLTTRSCYLTKVIRSYGFLN